MKKVSILVLVALLLSTANLFAQKVAGFGAELSVLSIKPNFRTWISKKTGFEVFGGIASETNDVKPNDFEVGVKYLHTLLYQRTTRVYIGVMGKYKWVDLPNENARTSLPIPGFFVGKEWYSKRVHRKGFALEMGYQFGTKEFDIFSPANHTFIGKDTFNEFPLILNIRYSFYTKR